MSRKALAAFGLLLGGALVIAACNGIGNVGNLDGSADSYGSPGNSDGRKNAARTIDASGGKMIHVYLAQMNPADALETRCLPFGGGGFNAWPVIAERTYTTMRATPFPDGQTSEYDHIAQIAFDNEICLGIRTPNEPNFPLQFTQVEFNLRSVSPYAYGHLPGNDYLLPRFAVLQPSRLPVE